MRFLDEFNEKTNEKYSYLRVANVVIHNKPAKLDMEFLLPHDMFDILLDKSKKQEIFEAVRSIIPMTLEIHIEFRKSFIDNDIVKEHTLRFFKTNNPTINIESEDIEVVIIDGCAHIEVTTNEMFYDYLSQNCCEETIVRYLSHNFCNPVKFRLKSNKKSVNFEVDLASEEEVTYFAKKVRTTNHEKLIGAEIATVANYISNCPEVEEKATYCGKILELKCNISKKTGYPYYVMTISDSTGKLMCKGFTKNSDKNKYDELKEGDSIIVFGNINLDTFLKDSVMIINRLSKCEIDYDSIITKPIFKEEKKYYSVVKPQKYVDMQQVSLFDNNQTPTNMLGKSYVVFDVETTGLSAEINQIIELAGAKIVNGEIVETFSSFVKPSVALPEEIISLTGITEDDVADAPDIAEVLPDFYKFTRDCALVAHNAKFDMSFLNKNAKELNYNFDNVVYDTLAMAQASLRLKNYKLASVCEYYNVELNGAHRAINDCIATAKVFIELMKSKLN